MSRYKNLHIGNGSDDRGEDWVTATFLKGLAAKAGWNTTATKMKDVRWDKKNGVWVDGKGHPITALYKQFPWELILRQSVAKDFVAHHARMEMIMEPAWKMILSTRAILPALYEMFPESELVTPARMGTPKGLSEDHVAFTVLPSSSRNEMGVLKGRQFTSWGESMKDFSNLKSVGYRNLELPRRYRDASGGYRFTYMSVFTVAGNMAGVGFRETRLPLLGAHSTFKPHLVIL